MHNQLYEALQYQDLKGFVKPTLHVDEFASKMGDDEDVIVLSFFVRDAGAAKDLVNWFEKGYDWVLDADQSPGEISPGRYLVYVEMRRRSTAADKVQQMLEDLTTLTDIDVDQWSVTYQDATEPFTPETFSRMVPDSPREYRQRRERGLDEMRVAAGLDVRTPVARDREILKLRSAAGI